MFTETEVKCFWVGLGFGVAVALLFRPVNITPVLKEPMPSRRI